jgi:GrxC family glutaredoxin
MFAPRLSRLRSGLQCAMMASTSEIAGGQDDAGTETEEVMVADIVVYSTQWCPYCVMAKKLLEAKGLTYREIDVTHDEALRQEMVDRSGRRTVPEIFIDDDLVGGYDELARLNATGELDRRLGLG